MTVCHFGHSVLPTRTATGPPSVCPWRTPPVSSTSSASKLMRAATPITKSPPGQVVGQIAGRDLHTGRQAVQDRNERGAMRFAGGQVTQHVRQSLRTARCRPRR